MAKRSPRVIVVLLRRPDLGRADERRDDPFWEMGSFGCTGCHRRNFMNPKRASELDGACLAFVQGGSTGFRMVHVTPPVTTRRVGTVCEANWLPADMPLTYATAPTVIDNRGYSDIPLLAACADGMRRPTPMTKFTSAFRSRRVPLPETIGTQVLNVYRRFRRRGVVAARYEQALPYPPPVIDRSRRQRYRSLRSLCEGIPLGKRC